MDRTAQIEYCKPCLNKAFDSKVGMVCSLTKLIPKIEESCAVISIDPQIEKLEKWKKENPIHPDRYSRSSAGAEGSIYDLDRKQVLMGIILLIAGIGLTIYSYLNSHSYGNYTVYWGAVLIGLWKVFSSVTEKE